MGSKEEGKKNPKQMLAGEGLETYNSDVSR